MAAFGELGVCDEITEGLEEIGWNLPTDIQAEAVPLIRDYTLTFLSERSKLIRVFYDQ